MQGMFEWQRSAIQQGQRTMEQAIDMQRNMTESLWRNNLGTGRSIQQQQTEWARNWADAFFGAMGTMMSREETDQMRQTLDDQFQELNSAQEDAWEAFQQSMNESMGAYDDLTQSQKEVFNRSVESFMQAQSSMGEEVANVAEEMGQQAREMGQQSQRYAQGGGGEGSSSSE